MGSGFALAARGLGVGNWELGIGKGNVGRFCWLWLSLSAGLSPSQVTVDPFQPLDQPS